MSGSRSASRCRGWGPLTRPISPVSGYDDWNEININRYPSRRTILELFSNPKYLEVMPYKLVGLKLMTVPTDLRFQLPDLRLALGTVFLIILLAVGWIRSAGRSQSR